MHEKKKRLRRICYDIGKIKVVASPKRLNQPVFLQPATGIDILIAMQLQGRDSAKIRDIHDGPGLLIHKNSDGSDERREVFNDTFHFIRRNKTRAFFVKNKPV